jgi:hypothetical protein
MEEYLGGDPEFVLLTRIRDRRAQVSKLGLVEKGSVPGKVRSDEEVAI